MATLSSRRQPRRRASCARNALAAVGLAALSGCSVVSAPLGWFSSSSAAPGAPAAACPSATVLRALAQTAVFAPGAQRQPAGVAFYGILSDVDAKCDQAGNAVRTALDVVVIGERGPAAGKAEGVDLQYFVAVMGADQTVLSKRSFAVHIPIPGNARRAGVTDHVEEMIPLGSRPPGEVSIVIGFQQGPEVVEFYKRFRGR